MTLTTDTPSLIININTAKLRNIAKREREGAKLSQREEQGEHKNRKALREAKKAAKRQAKAAKFFRAANIPASN